MQVNNIKNKYVGIPYVHRGRSMGGLDCWGLALLIYRDLGINVWDIDDVYDESWNWRGKSLFIENYHKEWERVETPIVFDGVLFKSSKNIPLHCGVYLGNDEVIHCVRNAGVVVSKITNEIRLKIEGFYRIKQWLQ